MYSFGSHMWVKRFVCVCHKMAYVCHKMAYVWRVTQQPTNLPNDYHAQTANAKLLMGNFCSTAVLVSQSSLFYIKTRDDATLSRPEHRLQLLSTCGKETLLNFKIVA